jgi:hypothetical protein
VLLRYAALHAPGTSSARSIDPSGHDAEEAKGPHLITTSSARSIFVPRVEGNIRASGVVGLEREWHIRCRPLRGPLYGLRGARRRRRGRNANIGVPLSCQEQGADCAPLGPFLRRVRSYLYICTGMASDSRVAGKAVWPIGGGGAHCPAGRYRLKPRRPCDRHLSL